MGDVIKCKATLEEEVWVLKTKDRKVEDGSKMTGQLTENQEQKRELSAWPGSERLKNTFF